MPTDQLQITCRDKAFYALGTCRLFERRMAKLEKRRAAITYLGIVIPLLVGGIVLGLGQKWLPYLLVPAGLLGTLQICLSAWSLVARWDEKYAYAVTAVRAQTSLFNEWDRLAKRPPADIDAKLQALEVEDARQEQADLTQNLTPGEKRYAMHAALYYFGSECRACRQKPLSMKPAKCDTCGNY